MKHIQVHPLVTSIHLTLPDNEELLGDTTRIKIWYILSPPVNPISEFLLSLSLSHIHFTFNQFPLQRHYQAILPRTSSLSSVKYTPLSNIDLLSSATIIPFPPYPPSWFPHIIPTRHPTPNKLRKQRKMSIPYSLWSQLGNQGTGQSYGSPHTQMQNGGGGYGGGYGGYGGYGPPQMQNHYQGYAIPSIVPSESYVLTLSPIHTLFVGSELIIQANGSQS